MKITNIDKEILHIVWTTWGIWIKFSGKMWLMIILSHKNQSFTPSLEDTCSKKPQGGRRGGRVKNGLHQLSSNVIRTFIFIAVTYLKKWVYIEIPISLWSKYKNMTCGNVLHHYNFKMISIWASSQERHFMIW